MSGFLRGTVLSQPGNLPHFRLIITFNYRNVTPTTSNSWCHIALVWRALLSEIHWSISGVWLPESNEDRADLSSWDYKPACLVVTVYIPIVAGWWNYIATFIEETNRWDMWHCFVFLKKSCSGWWDVFQVVTKEGLFKQAAHSGLLRFSFAK